MQLISLFSSAAARRFPTFLSWCGLMVFAAAGMIARGSELPPAFSFNLPFADSQTTPSWLGHPEILQTSFATINLPIQPPDPNASLLVTLFFQEKQGGFLRIIWQGTQSAQVLSDNFYEGIAMSNQRSLLVSPATMAGGGKLNLQCGDTSLSIQKIKLEWLETKVGLGSSQSQDVLVTPEVGQTTPAQIFNGQSKPDDAATWKNRVVTVPIADAPQRIEDGVEFSAQLDAVPTSGRLVLKESGLSMGKHLVVWINQQYAGIVTPVVPNLSDAGYLSDNPPDVYVGWRDGSFYVPVGLLKAEDNAVQFSVEDDVPSNQSAASAPAATAPLAVKNVAFQFNYPAQSAANTPAVSQPQSSPVDANESLPTGPVESTPAPTASSQPDLLPGPGEMKAAASTPSETSTP